MDLTETILGLAVCAVLLTVAVALDRRPNRPGKFNYILLMIITLTACLLPSRHLLSLLRWIPGSRSALAIRAAGRI